MHDRRKTFLEALRLLAIAALAASAFGSRALAFQDEGTVRIGLLESQTGTYAPFGLANLWGTIIALDEINARGGVTVDGKKVTLQATPSPVGYDAGADPAQSVALLKRLLLDDKVLMIKGVSNSNSGTAVFNYLAELEKEGNPIVVHSSSVGTPGLTKLSTYAFRNSFIENDVVINGLVKAVVARTQAKTAGFFIMKDNPYYQTIIDKFVAPALTAAGVEVKVTTEGNSSERDFTRQVNEIRAANPDLVFVFGQTLPTVNFMKEARRRQLKPKLFVGSQSVITAEALQSGGEALDGMVAAGGFDAQSPLIAPVAAEYQKRHAQELNFLVVTGYEAAYLIKGAIERSGIKNTPETLIEDRRKIRDALAATSIDSITGEKVSFNADRETPKHGVNLVVKDKRFVLWTE